MALISMRQLLDYAAEHQFAIPAFNVSNMEQVQAIMQAADAVDSPVILQGSAGSRSYAGEPFLRHLILAAIEQYPHLPVVMHQDHGADVNATTPDGKTPLMFAAMFNQTAIMELLLSHGANADLQSADGMTAMSLAQSMNAQDSIQLLSNR